MSVTVARGKLFTQSSGGGPLKVLASFSLGNTWRLHTGCPVTIGLVLGSLD